MDALARRSKKSKNKIEVRQEYEAVFCIVSSIDYAQSAIFP